MKQLLFIALFGLGFIQADAQRSGYRGQWQQDDRRREVTRINRGQDRDNDRFPGNSAFGRGHQKQKKHGGNNGNHYGWYKHGHQGQDNRDNDYRDNGRQGNWNGSGQGDGSWQGGRGNRTYGGRNR